MQLQTCGSLEELVGLWINGDPLRPVSCNGMPCSSAHENTCTFGILPRQTITGFSLISLFVPI